MPAKGWRKDEQETNFESAMDIEKISIDSLLFPKATINKIAKQMLQQTSESNMLLAKDSQTVIQRSAVLFINYIYDAAKQIVKEKGKKVVNADDILTALENTNFGSFVPVLKDGLDTFNAKKLKKKQEKERKKKEEADEEDEEDEDAKGESNKRAKLDATKATAIDAAVDTLDEDNNDTSAEHLGATSVAAVDDDADATDKEQDEGDNEDEELVLNASQKLQQEQKELEGEPMEDDNDNTEDAEEY